MSDKASPATMTARATAALALLLVNGFLLNNLLFPHFIGINDGAREVSTYCGVVFFLLLGVAAYRKPSVFREKAWSAISFLALFAGIAFLYLGITLRSPLLLAIGSPFGGIGTVWFAVLTFLTLMKLGPARCTVCIPTAFVASYAVNLALSLAPVPFELGLALYALTIVAAFALVRGYAIDTVETIRTVDSPIVLDVTNPSSYLPFSHPVFVSILLFNAAYGYALNLQAAIETPAQMLLSFVPVTAVFLMVVIGRMRLNADVLFQTSTLLVFAGFLTAPLVLIGSGAMGGLQFSSVFLHAGASAFTLLMYFLVAVAGSRNMLGGITTVAFAMGASWCGIGIGALIGQAISGITAGDVDGILWASAFITFGFMFYSFVVLKKFSFESTMQDIVPVVPAAIEADGDGADDLPSLEDNCRTVAERFGLTNRESEVLELLARGRTSPVIQEKLFLSHNTVKTHVRHIYTKMGIHSQQELIDIVEAAADEDGSDA
ncbi:helix-turn-helix domain-containing protein [Raoultibacter massiliensis]|uniref:LuxR C-terminal-related transcriptional regulator n=1 Tax=Raoultibacter massiliensis TaxID=1852371 RepID=A0ABV1JAG0_9ACTN|nr:LuxR family transcriptional regulator [Raoultibacter massiliensis]